MSVFLLTNWFVEKQWMFLYRRAPRASNFLIEVLYVTTVHQCRQNPLEEISGISLSHTHTMNVKGLTRVHGAGALRSCQSPWCSAVPAEHGSILARLSSQSSPSPDWLSPLEYSQSACPSVPSSALLFFLLMQQRLQWVSECVGERTCVCALPLSESPSAAAGAAHWADRSWELLSFAVRAWKRSTEDLCQFLSCMRYWWSCWGDANTAWILTVPCSPPNPPLSFLKTHTRSLSFSLSLSACECARARLAFLFRPFQPRLQMSKTWLAS